MTINKILLIFLIIFLLFLFSNREKLTAFSFNQTEKVSCDPLITSSCYTPVPMIDYTNSENVNYSFSRLENNVSVNGVPNLVLHFDKNVINNFEIYFPGVSTNSGDELYIFGNNFFQKFKNGYYQVSFKNCTDNTLYYQTKNGLKGGLIHLHNLY